jgi:hypothetical protein
MEGSKFLPPLRPVSLSTSNTAEQYPYGYTYLAKQKTQGLKRVCAYPGKEPQVPPLRFAPVGMTILSCPHKPQREILTLPQNCHPDRSAPGFPTSHCWQQPRVRLSVVRAACRSSTPRVSTGNPGERSGGTCGSFPSTHTRSKAQIFVGSFTARLKSCPDTRHKSSDYQKTCPFRRSGSIRPL